MPKTFIYPFVKIGDIHRPYIPIRVTNPFEKVAYTTLALLDTGADACVLPKGIADITKHNLKGDGVETHITQGVGQQEVMAWI